MKDISKFQLVVFGIFIVGAVIAVILFATTKAKKNGEGALARVTIWGYLKRDTFTKFSDSINEQIPEKNQRINIVYEQKDPTAIHAELLEAIADGRAPDIVVLPNTYIDKYARRLFLIPYETLSRSAFSGLFTEGAEVFKLFGGIGGIPFSIDPLVLYWNRDIFTNANIAQPPSTWDDVQVLVKKLTVKDKDFRIEQSAIALGEYQNITHAKEILSALALQNGSPITELREGNVSFPAFGPEMQTALTFYTSFADPSSDLYSWNRSLLTSKEQFLQGKLAMYIGYGSEAAELRDKNPNLNFDVALLPQIKNTSRKTTFGVAYGFAILRTSPRVNDALSTVWKMTTSAAAEAWTKLSSIPPVQRSLLGRELPDRYGTLLNQSALIAKSWHDPDPVQTDIIFNNLIETVTSGKLNPAGALTRASDEMMSIIGN